MVRKRRDNHIPGIHNYCDRWCERCDYTGRCSVFADIEREDRALRGQAKEEAASQERTLRTVGRSFDKTRRLLERWARKEGIDLEQLARQGSQDMESHRASISRHPVAQAAEAYTLAAGQLLKKVQPILEDSVDDIKRRGGFMDVDPEMDRLWAVREAIEVVNWDHILITAKMRRALSGLLHAQQEEEDLRPMAMREANGSAHVTRRSLRRSCDALRILYHWDKQIQDACLSLLVQGDRLLRSVEKLFPGCVEFVWPPKEDPPPADQEPLRRG